MADDPSISANCRAQHRMPHRPERAHCTGCACSCHGVPAPANFRQIIERQRARARQGHLDTTPEPDPATDVHPGWRTA